MAGRARGRWAWRAKASNATMQSGAKERDEGGHGRGRRCRPAVVRGARAQGWEDPSRRVPGKDRSGVLARYGRSFRSWQAGGSRCSGRAR